jgi:hypothetical protein
MKDLASAALSHSVTSNYLQSGVLVVFVVLFGVIAYRTWRLRSFTQSQRIAEDLLKD